MCHPISLSLSLPFRSSSYILFVINWDAELNQFLTNWFDRTLTSIVSCHYIDYIRWIFISQVNSSQKHWTRKEERKKRKQFNQILILFDSKHVNVEIDEKVVHKSDLLIFLLLFVHCTHCPIRLSVKLHFNFIIQFSSMFDLSVHYRIFFFFSFLFFVCRIFLWFALYVCIDDDDDDLIEFRRFPFDGDDLDFVQCHVNIEWTVNEVYWYNHLIMKDSIT